MIRFHFLIKLLPLTIILCFNNLKAISQDFISKSFYGDSLDMPVYVDTSLNGGFVVICTKGSPYSRIISIFQTDSALNILWTNTIYGSTERFREVKGSPLVNGGVLVYGRLVNDSNPTFIPFIIKINSSGQMEWFKKYQIPNVAAFTAATEIPGEGIILASSGQCNIKVDILGNLIWCNNYSIVNGVPYGRKIIVSNDSSFTVLYNEPLSYGNTGTARFNYQGDLIFGTRTTLYFGQDGIDIRSLATSTNSVDTMILVSGGAFNNLGGNGQHGFGIMFINTAGLVSYANAFNIGNIGYLQGNIHFMNQNIYAIGANSSGLISVLRFDTQGSQISKYYFQSNCSGLLSSAMHKNGDILLAGWSPNFIGMELLKFNIINPSTSCSFPMVYSPGSNTIPNSTSINSGTTQSIPCVVVDTSYNQFNYNYSQVISCQTITGLQDLQNQISCFILKDVYSCEMPITIEGVCQFSNQANFIIYDTSGRKVFETKLNNNKFEQINHIIKAGIYIYSIEFQSNKQIGKILIY